jgi:hypothetical protein
LIEMRDPQARFVSAIDVTVAVHGTTVAMVAQVDRYATPVRAAGQVIPASVDAASFTVSGGVGHSYSSRLTLSVSGPRVRALAPEINATPTFVILAVASCPAPNGSITVPFRRGSSRWLLNINDGSPLGNTPTLTGTNAATVFLTPSTTLLSDVLAAAGLPSNYFQR